MTAKRNCSFCGWFSQFLRTRSGHPTGDARRIGAVPRQFATDTACSGVPDGSDSMMTILGVRIRIPRLPFCANGGCRTAIAPGERICFRCKRSKRRYAVTDGGRKRNRESMRRCRVCPTEAIQ